MRTDTRPEFCVGENVYLESYLDPPLQPAFKFNPATAIESQWSISGNFVNSNEQRSGKSNRYTRDESLLYAPAQFNPITSLWWIDGNPDGEEQTVSVNWKHVTFFNGQTMEKLEFAPVKVQVYKPTLSGYDHNDFREFFVSDDRSVLHYGYPAPDGAFGMEWWITLNCKYDGSFGADQLVNAKVTRYKNGIPYPDSDFNTHGGLWLDNDHPYGGVQPFTVISPSTHTYKLVDYPETETLFDQGFGRIRMEGNFVDYIIFKPLRGGDDNIYVTLATLNWDMLCVFSDSDGMIESLPSAPGNPSDSNAFPPWENTFHNPRGH